MFQHRVCWRVATVVAAVLGTLVNGNAVNLTPIPFTEEFEGGKRSYIVFRDGGSQIGYQPPSNWRLSGSASKLILTSDAPNADAQIEVTTVARAVAINQASLAQYSLLAQQELPRTVKNITVTETVLNPLKISGHDTAAISLQFDAFGITYRSKVIYMNRDSEQWAFRFTAPASSFRDNYEPFRRSLYTIHGM